MLGGKLKTIFHLEPGSAADIRTSMQNLPREVACADVCGTLLA
jgi:hypothetical protein